MIKGHIFFFSRGGSASPLLLDRLQAQLHALAADPETFRSDPTQEDKDRAEWDEYRCDLEKRQGEISDLMRNNAQIRKQYTDIVPELVIEH